MNIAKLTHLVRGTYAVAAISWTGLLPAYALIQTSRQYKLGYDYNPVSPVGPPRWTSVDPSKVGDWSDMVEFVNKSGQDLRIGNNECGINKNFRTSPVNLYPTMKCDCDHEILCKKINTRECGFKNMTFEIAPNTLRASMPYQNTTCLNPAMNKSGKLPWDWIFIWLEVHARSEHVIDGRRYDGEINLIHVGINDQKRELAIPTILLDASSPFDNPLLQRFLDKWQLIYDKVRNTCNQTLSTLNANLTSSYTTSTAANGSTVIYDTSAIDSSRNSGREMKQKGTTTSVEDDLLTMLDRYNSVLESHKYVATDYFSDDDDRLDNSSIDGSYPSSDVASERSLQTASNSTSSSYGPPYKYGQVYGPRRKQFPYDLFPTIYHYKYMGSLSSPPCSTIVRWDVFDEPMKISRRQLRQIGRLLGSYINEQTCASESVVSPSGENYRPLQVLSPQQNSAHCQLDRFRYWLYPLSEQ
jgi:carbonic anhydrase